MKKFENIDAIVQAIIDDEPELISMQDDLIVSLQQFNDGNYVINPASIRQKSKLSQSQFAKAIGISVNTLKSWEQGQRRPSGSAKVLLNLLARKPELISELSAI